MEHNDKHCTFEACPRLAYEGYEYCLDHLKHLTEVNVERTIVEVTSEELGVDANEVTRRARFIDDLGARSLDTLELVMAFDEAFNIDIPSGDVAMIQGVGDAITYVTNLLLSESRFLIDGDVNAEAIHQSVEQNPENVTRLLEQILRSPLFQDYISRLRLETTNIERVFRHAVRNNWVDHVTTVPEFDEGKALSRVIIIILCRKVLYYFSLKVKSVSFTSFPLSELKLSYQIKYSERNEVSEIEVSGGSRSVRGVDETFTFKTHEGVEGALTFLDKYQHNMEALK
jgi:acyl carrier protein